MVDALADGYERAQHLAVCQEEAARREFIDDLLHGEPIWGVSPNLERFGLCFSHTHTDAHAVAVAEGTAAYSEADPVARHVELAFLGRFGDRQTLLTTKDGRLICIAPGDQTDVLTYFAKQAHAPTDSGRVAVAAPTPAPTASSSPTERR